MGIVKNIVGAVITVAIGGTVYTVSQTDIVDNFAKDTGLSQQESKEYVEKTKDSLVSWDKVGDALIADATSAYADISTIDCVNYTYDWVTPLLTCEQGKAQINKMANDEMKLGNAYKKLSNDSSTKEDIPPVIVLIDVMNKDYELSLVTKMMGADFISESKRTNSYNKATLQAVLNSDS